jgi:hypothetical protein
VPQPHPVTQIEDVIERDPRFRQPLDHQQVPQMPGVRTATLRPLLPSLQPRRLCEMHYSTNPTQFLDHEPPAGRRLQRDLQLPAAERDRNFRTAARSAGTTRARCSSLVSVSIHSPGVSSRRRSRRARVELEATGEHARKLTGETRDDLIA